MNGSGRRVAGVRGWVMQWLSSRPPGRSRLARNRKYAGSAARPRCSVSPIELTASNCAAGVSR